jgi:hypothetical protein
MSLAQTASTKAGVRLESAPASSATDTGKTKSNRSISATLKQKMSGRSSHLEESAASGKVTSGFIKYLAKAARGSRARAYYWLGVDRGERGQYGEALAFLKMASDELDVSFSSKGLNIHKSEKSKEEKKESTRDKEDLLKLIAHFSASYKQLNDSVAFQPIPNSSLLTSQIPAGRSATTIKAYTMPPAAFGPGSVDDLSSSVQTMKGLGGEGEASGVHEYAGKDAYY